MVALIAVVIIGAVTLLGSNLNDAFKDINVDSSQSLDASPPPPCRLSATPGQPAAAFRAATAHSLTPPRASTHC